MTHPAPHFGIPLPGVDYWYRPGAYAIIRGDGDLIAFVPGPRQRLFLPGGGINTDETTEAALLREIAEEIGWDARILGGPGHATQYLPRYGEKHMAVRATYFRAALTVKRKTPCEHEAIWLPLTAALPDLARESDAWAIAEVLNATAAEVRL